MGTIGGPQVGYIYEDAFRELYAEKSVEAEPDPAEAAPEGPARSCIRDVGRISTGAWSNRIL